MLAADAELDVGPGPAPALDADPHELADAVLVDGDEGVGGQNPLLGVGAEEGRGVVARDAERRLGQVVRAEGEELRRLGDLSAPRRRGEARSWCRSGTSTRVPVSLATASAMASMRSLTRSNSARVTTSGTMISGTTAAPVVLGASTAASKIARACISAISG